MRTNQWTEAHKEYLRKHYANTPMEDMISHLGRTARAIHTKASALRITGARWGVDHNKRPKEKKPLARGRKSKGPSQESRNTRRYKTIPFTTEGKRRVQIDAKTSVYVPANATAQEVETIVNRYRKAG